MQYLKGRAIAKLTGNANEFFHMVHQWRDSHWRARLGTCAVIHEPAHLQTSETDAF